MNVNLLIIGSQKSGTTSLYHYLNSHPDVYFSEIKETNYFIEDRLYLKGNSYFHTFFPKYSNQKVVATSHAHLLPCEKAPRRVFEYNPNMKLICMLRDPSERAYSAFLHAKKHGWESAETYSEALEKEKSRKPEIFREMYDLAYVNNGLYFQHLSNWSKYFPSSQLLILTIDELKANPEAMMMKIFNFLDLSPIQIDFSKRYNESETAKSKLIQSLMTKVVKNQNSSVKKFLKQIFPQSISIFIRSKIIPLIIKMNFKKLDKKTVKSEFIDTNYLFESDLNLLNEHYGIKLK